MEVVFTFALLDELNQSLDLGVGAVSLNAEVTHLDFMTQGAELPTTSLTAAEVALLRWYQCSRFRFHCSEFRFFIKV